MYVGGRVVSADLNSEKPSQSRQLPPVQHVDNRGTCYRPFRDLTSPDHAEVVNFRLPTTHAPRHGQCVSITSCCDRWYGWCALPAATSSVLSARSGRHFWRRGWLPRTAVTEYAGTSVRSPRLPEVGRSSAPMLCVPQWHIVATASTRAELAFPGSSVMLARSSLVDLRNELKVRCVECRDLRPE